MSIKKEIDSFVQDHISTIQLFFKKNRLAIDHLAGLITIQIQSGKKILVCGNGGSATDAMHFVGELVGRFEKERMPLPAIALNADVCTITALANDYGYDQIFSKQIEALGKEEDILIAISTSGKSKNVLRALRQAKKQKMVTVLLTGAKGKQLNYIDLMLDVPNENTARIQECHGFLFHVLANLIEKQIVDK